MRGERGAKNMKNRLKLAATYVKVEGASKTFEAGINENDNKEDLD